MSEPGRSVENSGVAMSLIPEKQQLLATAAGIVSFLKHIWFAVT
jgi:lipoprotein signal peptidase